MRVFVRACLRAGITFSEFRSLAQHSFVHEGSQLIATEDGDKNISRTAYLTGISRKTVRAILADEQQPMSELAEVPYLGYSDVFYEWRRNPAYVDDSGEPKAIRIRGEKPSFEALVDTALVGQDAAAIFDTALADGSIELVGSSKCRPWDGVHLAQDADDIFVYSFGRHLVAHANTIVHNMASKGPLEEYRPDSKRLEWLVQVTNDRSSLPKIRKTIQLRSMNFARETDEYLELLTTHEKSEGGDEVREPMQVMVGIYYAEID